jgi:tRNA A22 N-methylase
MSFFLSNIQTQSLRTLLQDINYQIIDERIMEEKGHIYEIVVAEYLMSCNNVLKLCVCILLWRISLGFD